MAKLRIAFRVDASTRIGSGHVTRCAALAECLEARGAEVVFLCRELPGHYCDWLASREQAVCRLPAPNEAYQEPPANGSFHAAWLGVPLEQELREAGAALAEAGPFDWLVVDHYALGVRWETKLRHAAARMLVIDDLADRKHDCDALLDQNYFYENSKRYEGLLPDHCVTLLGPSYCVLRREFFGFTKYERVQKTVLQRVLVSFGGSDYENLTGCATDALLVLRRDFPDLEADIVIGAGNPHRENLFAKYSGIGWLCLHSQVSNMAELMQKADLAIGAGGGTLWERCVLGLPATVVIASDNQRDCCNALAEAGVIHLIGDASSCTAQDIASAVRGMVDTPGRLQALSRLSRAIMENWAPFRVCDELIALTPSNAR